MASKRSGGKAKSGARAKRGKPGVEQGLRDLPTRKLSGEQAKNVKGGGKQIGGVKYNDF